MARVNRQEFSKAVKLEMFRRAGGPGSLRCEGCQQLLKGKPFEYDHTLECWEMEDVVAGLRPPLTAEDGKLLGKACCHARKTAQKAGERAHVKRIVEKQARAKPASRAIPGSRNSPWKRRMDGTMVRRDG